ncbi:MAG: TIGR03905 family TSCPD domain-containing protein [Clostridia bacterium]|nr:TIGR03905 family TSCPD domain-containing protein [Clostridia bacterium]
MRFSTRGTCSRAINIEVENGIVKHVEFEGGCSGNTQGVARLVEGMKIDIAIDKLSGIKCGFKDTSCPDQLAKALIKIREEE